LGQAFSYALIGLGVCLLATGVPADGIWLMILGWFFSQGAALAIVSSRFAERIEASPPAS
jgi:hypothetical protein